MVLYSRWQLYSTNRRLVNIATQQPSIYQVASNRLFHFPAGSYLNTYNYVISGAKRYISFLKLVGLKLDYYISVLYSKSVLTGILRKRDNGQ